MSRKLLTVSCCALFVVCLTVQSHGQAGRPPAPQPPQPPPPPLGRLGTPLPTLNKAELARFNAGLSVFNEVHDVAAGLGPVFNDNACAACHTDGGIGGGSPRLVTRFGRVVDGQFDAMTEFGGSLIQVKGIGKLGTTTFVGEVVPKQATIVAQRRTTPLFGLGFVDNIPDTIFHQIADHQMLVNPTIAGRVNVVFDTVSGQQRVGRFGWKCQQATLHSFAGDAYLNEMGITTPLFPAENCPQGNCALLNTRGLPPEPNEPDNNDLFALADFMAFLAPPQARPNQQTAAGATIFAQIGCADCHLPILQTGPNTSAAFNQVVFTPYSDFLLHDMGTLGDGIVQSGAGAREMRTAPLWGLSQVTRYLHDGRATNLPDAITAHDGQGRAAAKRFSGLAKPQRDQLVLFLNSL